MRSGYSRVSVVLAMVLVLLVVVALRRGRERPQAPPPPPVASAPPPPATAPPPAKPALPAVAAIPSVPPAARGAKDEKNPLATLDPMVPQTPELSWDHVDLDAVRAVMPDNMYWRMSAPTKDPEIIRQREEERERWNVEYGKVLSNTATAEEIDAYYALRQRLMNDNIAFAGYLLAAYGQKLPEQDVALLKLAVKLNLARLEEIPRQITEAQQRREEHDAARRAWLEDQRAFEQKQADGQ
jgi:hypothetical protein